MTFKLNTKAFHMPDINKSIAAKRRPHKIGVVKMRINKGLMGSKMPKIKI